MRIDRRTAIIGAAALGATGSASALPPMAPAVRRDLYGAETDPAAILWKGERNAIPVRINLKQSGEPGEAMSISGVVYKANSNQPAADVVVYVYHTDHSGLYAGGSNESVWSRRHGLHQGWMRTGADGRYAFDSIKPGLYPARNTESHVHMHVIEPGRPPYWIDSIVFDGEFGVNRAYRAKVGNRGGSGIIRLSRPSGVWTGVRDIRLERHPA